MQILQPWMASAIVFSSIFAFFYAIIVRRLVGSSFGLQINFKRERDAVLFLLGGLAGVLTIHWICFTFNIV